MATLQEVLEIHNKELITEYTIITVYIGLLAFLAACVLMLVVAVIVWRPRDAGLYPMKHWKPKYRSLGAPPPVPNYVSYDEDHWPSRYNLCHL